MPLSLPPTPDRSTPCYSHPHGATPLHDIRRRAQEHGWATLNNAELLSLMIRDARGVQIAHDLLSSFQGSLDEIARMSLAALDRMPGIGASTAAAIGAALELGRRRLSHDRGKPVQIKRSYDAYEVLRPVLMDLPHEEFWVLLLDTQQQMRVRLRVSVGGVSSTLVDPKVLFRLALEWGATGLIVAHNHPSGHLMPSQDDIALTDRLCKGAPILGLKLCDHLIVTATGYYSFADHGLM